MPMFINTHFHLLNFTFIPDNFYKIKAPIREWLLRHKVTAWLARGFSFVWPFKKNDELYQVIKLMKKDIPSVAQAYAKEMSEADEIVLATPLMMDLEFAIRQAPETPYMKQVQLMSEIARTHPGRLMPFIMFDPRRDRILERIKIALDTMGFLGVKMYTPLGYHPDPDSFVNDPSVNDALQAMYEYCVQEDIPITTHCSPGGAFSLALKDNQELAQEFAHPDSWAKVLAKFPTLRLNVAHYGGGDEFMKGADPQSWAAKTEGLIEAYPQVYTDLANHTQSVKRRKRKTYFRLLTQRLKKSDRIKQRVMFGTDWPMARYTWKEKDYTKQFEKRLDADLLEVIAFDNPLAFLFPGKIIPERILTFYTDHGHPVSSLPQWMKEYFNNVS